MPSIGALFVAYRWRLLHKWQAGPDVDGKLAPMLLA